MFFFLKLCEQYFGLLIVVDRAFHWILLQLSVEHINQLLPQRSAVQTFKANCLHGIFWLQRMWVASLVNLILLIWLFCFTINFLEQAKGCELLDASRTHPLVRIPHLKLFRFWFVCGHQFDFLWEGVDCIPLALPHHNFDYVSASKLAVVHNRQEYCWNFLKIWKINFRLHLLGQSLNRELKLVLLFQTQIIALYSTIRVIDTEEYITALGVQKSIDCLE